MTVSVCILTYNHVNFIKEALDGVLAQEVSFVMEILIADDCSTDGTTAICERYAADHPKKVKHLKRLKNLGMLRNFADALGQCTGRYIAVLEGDDYWTSQEKLQTQIDFLEYQPTYVASFHNVLIDHNRNGKVYSRLFHTGTIPQEYDTRALLRPWFIPSCSLVVRNLPDFNFPDWFFNCQSGDISWILLLSLQGKFWYHPLNMGVYRMHEKGASAGHIGYNKIISVIYIYESFNHHTAYQFHRELQAQCAAEIAEHLPFEPALFEKLRLRAAALPEPDKQPWLRLISRVLGKRLTTLMPASTLHTRNTVEKQET